MKKIGDKAFLAITIVALFLCIIAVFALTYQSRDLKVEMREIREQFSKTQHYTPKDGRDGKDGVSEIVTKVVELPGVDGKDGVDGRNATDEQIKSAVSDYMASNPVPKGDQGEPGVPGITVFVRKNPVSSALECRMSTDFRWYPIDNCL